MYVYHLWRRTKMGREKCIGAFASLQEARTALRAITKWPLHTMYIVDSSHSGRAVYYYFSDPKAIGGSITDA